MLGLKQRLLAWGNQEEQQRDLFVPSALLLLASAPAPLSASLCGYLTRSRQLACFPASRASSSRSNQQRHHYHRRRRHSCTNPNSAIRPASSSYISRFASLLPRRSHWPLHSMTSSWSSRSVGWLVQPPIHLSLSLSLLHRRSRAARGCSISPAARVSRSIAYARSSCAAAAGVLRKSYSCATQADAAARFKRTNRVAV